MRCGILTSLHLARAVAANPIWSEESHITVVLRPAPDAMIGVLGYFNVSNKQLDAIGWQLNSLLSRLRYVDYRQAESGSQRVGRALLEKFGRSALRAFRFTAIPRGGYIVLGMLSYLLDLGKEQLLLPSSLPKASAPLVVVDDCAITGFRFRQFLQRFPEESIIFAHLYSHPNLRRAILEQEPRVIACIGGHDLHDHAPGQLGERYENWRGEAATRAGDDRYWIGLPEHICFPWNEPDSGIWNPHTERVEHGWRVLPPELCLKNRPLVDFEAIPVQIQPEGKGALKPSRAVLFGVLESELILGNVETGNSYSLQGVSARMWQAFIEYGNVDDVVSTLVQIYAVDEARLRADVETFASQLLSLGLLEHNNDDYTVLPAPTSSS